MKSTILLLFVGLAVASCQNSQTPAEPPKVPAPAEAAVTAAQAETKPTKAPDAPATDVALVADGKVVTFQSMLVWTEEVGGSMVPQMRFFVGEVGCENRLTRDVEHFYAATQGENWEPGEEVLSPNWGFSGMPEFNPSSENDTGYPPAYWGKVKVVASTASEVQGTVDFSAKDVTIRGNFKATRCTGSAFP